MMTSLPRTVGELRAAGYQPISVKDEIRKNLLVRLRAKEPLFPGVLGYDDSVIPQLVNALLARQNFILLGLRGQAKTRLLRALTTLLDPELPMLAGTEINDNPFAPLSAHGKRLLAEQGDEAPLRWIAASERYVEKLATPDVTIADLIGDIDPIKAARSGSQLADEESMHFGLLPRANRGIFALNELPDLASKVQVGLFNMMQEGDVQIRGYKVRLPLDVLLVFSANPEDYTARGKIITPLKDRMGAEIRTHYARSVEEGMDITLQESWVDRTPAGAEWSSPLIEISPLVREAVERVAFLARADRRIDRRSGVSQRLPIALLDSCVSNAERRAVHNDEPRAAVGVADLYASLSAITGKLELEYEGEQIGAERIAKELIRRACGEVVRERLPGLPAAAIVKYFQEGNALTLPEMESTAAVCARLEAVEGLAEAARALADSAEGAGATRSEGSFVAACELILEALHAQKKLARDEEHGDLTFRRPNPEGKEQLRSFVVPDDLN